jgi:hypothetical protein
VAAGRPAEVITESNLARHFALRARVWCDEETGSLIVYPLGANSSSAPRFQVIE